MSWGWFKTEELPINHCLYLILDKCQLIYDFNQFLISWYLYLKFVVFTLLMTIKSLNWKYFIIKM